jgi:hypothetical protein
VSSLEDLDRKLLESRTQVRRFDHLAGQRKTMNGQIREVAELIAQLEIQLAKEQRDVARLEKGFGGFLAGLAGAKEEKLARERAEAEAAQERLYGQRRRLEGLTDDLEAADRELAALAGAHASYEALLADKERLLLEGGDERARRLAEVTGKLADSQADLREHTEAWEAGKAAVAATRHVVGLLDRARGASTWDMFGGGAFADLVEHGQLVKADQAAWHAQRALDVFSRELRDVGWIADLRLPKVDTRWFADAFFDNIITDAIKHQRISRTRDEVSSVFSWVESAVQALVSRHGVLTQQHARLLAEREQLIAG